MDNIAYINELKSLFLKAYSQYAPKMDMCTMPVNDLFEDIFYQINALTDKKQDYLSRVASTSTDNLDEEKIKKLMYQHHTLEKEHNLLKTSSLAVKFLLYFAQQQQTELHRLQVENTRKDKQIAMLKEFCQSASDGEKAFLERSILLLKDLKHEKTNYKLKIRN